MFDFVHIPPIFSVLLTYSLKIDSLLFSDPPCIPQSEFRCHELAYNSFFAADRTRMVGEKRVITQRNVQRRPKYKEVDYRKGVFRRDLRTTSVLILYRCLSTLANSNATTIGTHSVADATQVTSK